MAKTKAAPGKLDLALPELHPGQKRVRREAKRKNFLCAGRGWWKSSLLVDIAMEAALDGLNVSWVSHVFNPIKTAHREIWTNVLGRENWDKYYHVTDHLLEIPGKPPIVFASLEDPAHFRGGTPDVLICDEMGELPDGIYQSILSPMLLKSGGIFWGTGTPNAVNPFNDFWRFCTMDTGNRPGIANWVIPTLGANVDDNDQLIRKPHPYENTRYTWEALMEDWQDCPPSQRMRWRIEILCHFLSAEGHRIQNPQLVCTLPCTEGATPDEWFLQGYRISELGWYRGGVDIAISGDYTVLTVIDRTIGKQVYFRRFKPASATKKGRWRQIYLAIQRIFELFPGIDVRVDVTGLGHHVPETLQLEYGLTVEGVNFGGTGEKKASMMDHLMDVVEDQRIFFFDQDIIRNELAALEWKAKGKGFQIEGSGGEHDDIPVSFGLACENVRPAQGTGKDEPLSEKIIEVLMEDTSTSLFADTGAWARM